MFSSMEGTDPGAQSETSSRAPSGLHSPVRLSTLLEHISMDDARHKRIAELCVMGEELARQREFASALLRFREALALIPRPVEEHDAALRVLTALGDTCFQLGRYS